MNIRVYRVEYPYFIMRIHAGETEEHYTIFSSYPRSREKASYKSR